MQDVSLIVFLWPIVCAMLHCGELDLHERQSFPELSRCAPEGKIIVVSPDELRCQENGREIQQAEIW